MVLVAYFVRHGIWCVITPSINASLPRINVWRGSLKVPKNLNSAKLYRLYSRSFDFWRTQCMCAIMQRTYRYKYVVCKTRDFKEFCRSASDLKILDLFVFFSFHPDILELLSQFILSRKEYFFRYFKTFYLPFFRMELKGFVFAKYYRHLERKLRVACSHVIYIYTYIICLDYIYVILFMTLLKKVDTMMPV